MLLTYYGHSCFLIDTGSHKLLFDPFITGNPMAAGLPVRDIKAHFILVSHAHGDHMADALEIGKNNGAVLISNYEICNWFAGKGWSGGADLNHGGKKHFAFGTVRYVTAVHSSQFPDGAYGGNPGGFLVETPDVCFYFAGDTALTMDMKLIPMYRKPDFAMLPVGGNYTMDDEDALLAADFIECTRIVGMHFDTFPPIVIDHSRAVERFRAAGKDLLLLKPGDSMNPVQWIRKASASGN